MSVSAAIVETVYVWRRCRRYTLLSLRPQPNGKKTLNACMGMLL